MINSGDDFKEVPRGGFNSGFNKGNTMYFEISLLIESMLIRV